MKSPEERARELYDSCPTTKPAWEQLGEVTRSVWLERVADLPAEAELPDEESDVERQVPGQSSLF